MQLLYKNNNLFLIFTILFALILLFWGLGSVELMSLNEGRRALAIKEMFDSGNWLLPTQNGELYLTKPPLLYWCSLFFSQLFGVVNEWTLRLPSAFAGLAVLFMVYGFVKKYFNNFAALLAVQLLLANVAFVMLMRRAEIEMLLTALCLGALFSAIHYAERENKSQQWVYLSYFLMALAVLTKGPVAMLFVTLPLLVIAIFTKNKQVIAVLTNKIGWLIFLVVASSWYLAVTVKLGPDIWAMIAKRDMLGKMQSEDLSKPLLSYVGWIATDFLLLVGFFFYQSRRFWRHYQHQLVFQILCTACICIIIVFSLFSNKHAKYLLPIYPVIVILLSLHISLMTELCSQKFKKIVQGLGLLIPFVFVIFYIFAEAKVFDYRISVFPKFSAWTERVTVQRLYAVDDLDMRLFYYTKKPIKTLNIKAFLALGESEKSLLLLSEKPISDINFLQNLCEVNVFEPYLKKHKKLIVYGVGEVCHHQPKEVL
jgi:4-amino-4-deoxy-L-arabinose transferase-like glycosyltransferase